MNLELHNICKSFDGQVVLQDICYHDDITSVAVIGPSGGGKSTLIRIIGGLLSADSGEIAVDGKKIEQNEKALQSYRRDIGFVFQANGLFEHLTAAENVMLPLIHTYNISKTDAADTADRLFERFGLKEGRNKYPSQLSGGQQQRIAIARAIAVKPKLLILDEPTSALDPEYTVEVLNMLHELRGSGTQDGTHGTLQSSGRSKVPSGTQRVPNGLRSIIVTHEIGFAKNACDKVIFLANNRIIESGESSEIFKSPKTKELQSFLNKILEWKV